MKEEYKALLEEAKDYAFDYLEGVEERSVYPGREALEALRGFDEPLPHEGLEAKKVLERLQEQGAAATVAQIGGRYFGFVNGGVLPVALAARWMADVWDQNAALYAMSPLASKLEEVCEGWLRELFDLPEETAAGFVNGSSAAILSALAAARWRLLDRCGWDVGRQGLDGAPRLRIVAGREAHATVLRAVALLGLGSDRIEWVPTDDQGRILPSEIPPLDDRTILLLQAGNVNSGAFDDFATICPRAREAGSWVHIDGAFGLWAAASERLRHLTRGVALADSWSLDVHKTLNVPYDSGIVLCRDREALVRAFQISGAYIAESGERDGMFTTPEMSRRVRAVDLWATMRCLGRSGIGALVERLHQRALAFADALRAEGFEILNEVVFNQVLLGCASVEERDCILRRLEASGECWMGGSVWQGRAAIRISVCSHETEEEDLWRCVRALCRAR